MPISLPLADYQYPQQGAARPRIALVGEAPGADEIKLRRPFVGRAGQLLDRALLAAGIDRGQCLIANVFRYRPPENKIGHFFASRRKAAALDAPITESLGKMGSDYCLECYSGELEALRAALAKVGVDVVVALGRTPLWALTGLNGITAMRGKELPNRLGDAPVVATFHPSFVMRQNSIGPETEAVFVADLRLAKALAAGRAQPTSSSSPGIGAPG